MSEISIKMILGYSREEAINILNGLNPDGRNNYLSNNRIEYEGLSLYLDYYIAM